MVFRYRVSLLITGFIVFLLAGPAVVLFARGYSYDFEHHRFLKTGALVVRTDPRSAEVYLDGEAIGSSPLTRRLLHPDEYLVEVKKEGFMPWLKRVTIHPQGVSDWSRVVLFREKQNPAVLATSTVDFLVTEDGVYAAVKNDLALFRFHSGEKTLLATSTNIAKLASESPDPSAENENVIYGDKNEIWLVRKTDKEKKFLITRSSLPIENPILNRETGYVFFQVGTTLKAIELDQNGAPNVYDLSETKTPGTKFSVSPDGRALIYLENGTLFRLDIR